MSLKEFKKSLHDYIEEMQAKGISPKEILEAVEIMTRYKKAQ